MGTTSPAIVCDGCGVPASETHIADRVRRLELVTRFRPIHMNVLFVAASPTGSLANDFYNAPDGSPFFDGLMAALNIAGEGSSAKLLEFQRRGYFLAYLAECPPADAGTQHELEGNQSREGDRESSDATNSEPSNQRVDILIQRIRFNYKPKHVALLGENLHHIVKVFRARGMESLLLFDHGQSLTVPGCTDAAGIERFSAALGVQPASADSPVGV